MGVFAGVDIGSTTTKVVLVGDDKVILGRLTPSGSLPGKTARELFEKVLAEAGLGTDAVTLSAATGYGRRLVDWCDIVLTEIKACASGVLSIEHPNGRPRTVIDVGGQDTKVIALGEDGEVEDFSMNDKCAAGTGRFLEVLASKLGLSYAEFVEIAREPAEEIMLNSTCAVFAESEVVGLLARNVSKSGISAAAHDSIATRVASMVRRVGRIGPYCFVGGGAGNEALVRAVSENLNAPVSVPPDHQLVIALGAAVEARRKYGKSSVV